MESQKSSYTELFTKFLSEKEKYLKEQQASNLIISFAVPATNYAIEGRIDFLVRNSKTSFYFQQPSKDFLILGIDDILHFTEAGNGRFSITDKKIKEWKNKIVNNWSIIGNKRIPLFLGGMKFMVEHSDNDWKDFQDSTWFIPATSYLSIDSNNFFIFNFLYKPRASFQNIINQFNLRLEYFLGADKKELSPLPRIIKSEGNSPKDKKKWKQVIIEALENIEIKKIDKVVIARKVDFILSAEPDYESIISAFRNQYSNCNLFLYNRGNSSFFGASPETLGNFTNNSVVFDALAGSAPRGKDENDDKEFEKKLLSSEKDIAEHNFVIDHIKKLLSEFSDEVEITEKMSVVKLTNIQHLRSVISARLNSESSVLGILDEIYPTPAICGSPKTEALQLIKKLENFKRGLYSGIIGWFNFENEADFVVALRSALISGQKVSAYAGSGIVQNSDPDAEFSETSLKLKPVMTLFKDEN